MLVRELTVPGAWSMTPTRHADDRGVFLEWFTTDSFQRAVGHPLDLTQANLSVSGAGVVRGVHYADVPPGQAKYVTCPRGAVLDVVVDLRTGSPTFGQHDTVLLDDVDHRAVYLSEGLGHAFMSLEEGSTVVYLCSTGYAPEREHGIDPMDRLLDIRWPTVDRLGRPLTPVLSPKDEQAPGLSVALRRGELPRWETTQAHAAALRARATS